MERTQQCRHNAENKEHMHGRTHATNSADKKQTRITKKSIALWDIRTNTHSSEGGWGLRQYGQIETETDNHDNKKSKISTRRSKVPEREGLVAEAPRDDADHSFFAFLLVGKQSLDNQRDSGLDVGHLRLQCDQPAPERKVSSLVCRFR